MILILGLSGFLNAGDFIITDTLLQSNVAGFSATFDSENNLHYIQESKEYLGLDYVRYNSWLQPVDSLIPFATSDLFLLETEISYNNNLLLISTEMNSPGFWIDLVASFHSTVKDTRYQFQGISLGSTFVYNDGQASTARPTGGFLLAWKGKYGSTAEDGVLMRSIADTLEIMYGPIFKTPGARITSPLSIAYPNASSSGLVSWSENDTMLCGQYVSLDGIPVGQPFEIHSNPIATGIYFQKIISLVSGDFLLIWQERTASGNRIFKKVINDAGENLSEVIEVTLDGYKLSSFNSATDSSGHIIIIASALKDGDSYYDLFAQRLNKGGDVVGEPFKITSSTPTNDRTGQKVIIESNLVYTFWKESKEIWANVSDYLDPPLEILDSDFGYPGSSVLIHSYPNPFNPSTTIRYALMEESDVSVAVYDLTGRLVTTLYETHQGSGQYSVLWNATDRNGNQVPTGVYFVQVHAGNYSESLKIVYLN